MVHALVADAAVARAIAASFEEEGVPVTVERVAGAALVLARRAAREAPAGIGIGGDAERLVIVLAAAAGTAYVERPTAEARLVGTCAARLVRRCPLPFPIA